MFAQATHYRRMRSFGDSIPYPEVDVHEVNAFRMEHANLIMLLVAVLYLSAVRVLRYRRVDAMKRKQGFFRRSDYAAMTTDQAQDVLKDLMELEFPKLMKISMVFALFKSYGIPSISSLLVGTGELIDVERVSKRIADTGVLLLEFYLNKPSSDRAIEATARMNYLHSHYIKAGKISNDDMLYTLCVLALEPIRWINQYEWRGLSEFELCATGTFWKAMGDRMNIDYGPLHDEEWSDGIAWLEDVQQWSERYEQENMVAAQSTNKLALALLDMIFLNIPRSLRPIAGNVVSVLSGSRFQQAMMLPYPPYLYFFLIENAMFIRKLFIRHLMLPRLEIFRKRCISDRPEANGRYSSREYLSHPWYVRPTFKRRWGWRAWVTRLLGRKLPGDDGNRYNPEGYVISEVGPRGQTQAGRQERQANIPEIRYKGQKQRPSGI